MVEMKVRAGWPEKTRTLLYAWTRLADLGEEMCTHLIWKLLGYFHAD